jgi:hypothetical protein
VIGVEDLRIREEKVLFERQEPNLWV